MATKFQIKILTLILLLITTACGKFKVYQNDTISSNNDTLGNDYNRGNELINPNPLSTPNPQNEANLELLNLKGAGELKSQQQNGEFSIQDIQAKWGQQTNWAIKSKFAVKTFKLEYTTYLPNGTPITVSGLLVIPKTDGHLNSIKFPLLSYQHGTIFKNSQAPSQAISASEAPILIASLGFAVVAADYIGFGSSLGTPHPYLQTEPTSRAVVDLIIASKIWFLKNNFQINDQLLLLGYSQGAHASMAAHKYIQENPKKYLNKPTIMIGGGGPYSVQATLDGILRKIRDAEPLLGALIQPGVLEHLSSSVRTKIRTAVLKEIVPANSDIILDPLFLDLYLADNEHQIDLKFNTHKWIPTSSVFLMHGLNDSTVPYSSSEATMSEILRLSSGGAPINLTQCPSGADTHLGCVEPFFQFAFETIALRVLGF